MRPTAIAILLACFSLIFANRNSLVASEPSLQIDLGDGQVVELILVKPASFMQGSSTDEAGREEDELQHKVTLTKEFFISKYPITVVQFRRFVEETGYKTEAESGPSGGFGLVGDKLEQRPEFNWKNPGYPVKIGRAHV